MKNTTILLITILFASGVQAQYTPADSMHQTMQLHTVYELDKRLDILEQSTQDFERKARLGKYLMFTGATSMVLGTLAVEKNPGNVLAWFTTFSGYALTFAGNIIIIDSPNALRAKKDGKKRRVH